MGSCFPETFQGMGPSSAMLNRGQPLALYMEGFVGHPFGKMGHGLLRYSPNPVACVIDGLTAGGDLEQLTGIPREAPIVENVRKAKELGAEVLVLGIAPPGGALPPEWMSVLDEAVGLGMSLVNGLHQPLAPRYPDLSGGQFVWDVRREPEELGVGNAEAAKLNNRRVLMIGTDMAIGKMTAGLELVKTARQSGWSAEFVATGQIGMVIWGSGVALDAVRLDFASGAIEREVLRVRESELIVVEGQGSLVHPASSASLPLLRGSCPTHMILCHRAGQTNLLRVPEVCIPPLPDYIRLFEHLAASCGTFPAARVVAVALNTSHLSSDEEAICACEQTRNETGLPCVDPVRFGSGELLRAVI